MRNACHSEKQICAQHAAGGSAYDPSNYYSMAAWLTCYSGALMPVDMRMRAYAKNSLACDVYAREAYLLLVASEVASDAARRPHPATCGVIWSDHAAHLAAKTPGR